MEGNKSMNAIILLRKTVIWLLITTSISVIGTLPFTFMIKHMYSQIKPPLILGWDTSYHAMLINLLINEPKYYSSIVKFPWIYHILGYVAYKTFNITPREYIIINQVFVMPFLLILAMNSVLYYIMGRNRKIFLLASIITLCFFYSLPWSYRLVSDLHKQVLGIFFSLMLILIIDNLVNKSARGIMMKLKFLSFTLISILLWFSHREFYILFTSISIAITLLIVIQNRFCKNRNGRLFIVNQSDTNLAIIIITLLLIPIMYMVIEPSFYRTYILSLIMGFKLYSKGILSVSLWEFLDLSLNVLKSLGGNLFILSSISLPILLILMRRKSHFSMVDAYLMLLAITPYLYIMLGLIPPLKSLFNLEFLRRITLYVPIPLIISYFIYNLQRLQYRDGYSKSIIVSIIIIGMVMFSFIATFNTYTKSTINSVYKTFVEYPTLLRIYNAIDECGCTNLNNSHVLLLLGSNTKAYYFIGLYANYISLKLNTIVLPIYVNNFYLVRYTLLDKSLELEEFFNLIKSYYSKYSNIAASHKSKIISWLTRAKAVLSTIDVNSILIVIHRSLMLNSSAKLILDSYCKICCENKEIQVIECSNNFKEYVWVVDLANDVARHNHTYRVIKHQMVARESYTYENYTYAEYYFYSPREISNATLSLYLYEPPSKYGGLLFVVNNNKYFIPYNAKGISQYNVTGVHILKGINKIVFRPYNPNGIKFMRIYYCTISGDINDKK